MDPTAAILGWWLLFGVTHVVLSSLWLRPKLVSLLTPGGFLGVYSIVALVTFIPLVSSYFGHKHQGAVLWSIRVTPPVEAFVLVGMAVAFVMLVAGLLSPSPASLSTAGKSVEPAAGVHLITRHALFMPFGLFGFVHLLPNGFASDIAFFAGFPVFALIGCWHQDRRKLASEPERYTAYHAATPFIPFTGARTLEGLKQIPLRAYGLGLLLTALVRYFHASWFGG